MGCESEGRPDQRESEIDGIVNDSKVGRKQKASIKGVSLSVSRIRAEIVSDGAVHQRSADDSSKAEEKYRGGETRERWSE